MEVNCDFYSEKIEDCFFKYSRWPMASPTDLFFCPFTNRHVTFVPRPTPVLKPKPQGATPQPKPTRDGTLSVFSPTHAPTQAPYPWP
ncbi:hypothetical protein Hanom_Chr14g01246931 [Helianthus anomalus]